MPYLHAVPSSHLYAELPISPKPEFALDLPERSIRSRRHLTHLFGVLLAFVFFILIGSWSSPHIRQTVEQYRKVHSKNGEKALVISSFTHQDVNWLNRIPTKYVRSQSIDHGAI
jgi:hypothetical protein